MLEVAIYSRLAPAEYRNKGPYEKEHMAAVWIPKLI